MMPNSDGSGPAMQALAAGLSVVGAFWFGVAAVQAGRLDAVWLVVVTLLPLAAFETTLALPAAAVELVRGARSATRIAQLLDSSATGEQPGVGLPARTDPSRLVAHIDTGWDATVLRSFDLELDLRLGRSYALVGPSGIGKTSLLLTLAGLIPARAGSVRLDGPAGAGPAGQLHRRRRTYLCHHHRGESATGRRAGAGRGTPRCAAARWPPFVA
ncbi:MAG: hypothetical protein CSB46_02535 [Micrococcales bacterium]|nr:MAG: hypothetical protein CSB46_02535 [Micrococcales bacterium]